MKAAILLGSLLCFVSADSYADGESQQIEYFSVDRKHPHHIYLGPEVFLFDLDTHADGAKVHGLNFFSGLKLRYEYRKPKAFYAGVDLLGSWSPNGFYARYKKYHFHRNNGNSGFSNIELRFGYTFVSENKVFSPFLGIGAYGFANCGSHFHFSEDMFYYTGRFN